MRSKSWGLSSSVWACVAIVALVAGQVGCRACGGACNDYASPVAGAECGHCGGARAGSGCAGSGCTTGEVVHYGEPTPVEMVN